MWLSSCGKNFKTGWMSRVCIVAIVSGLMIVLRSASVIASTHPITDRTKLSGNYTLATLYANKSLIILNREDYRLRLQPTNTMDTAINRTTNTSNEGIIIPYEVHIVIRNRIRTFVNVTSNMTIVSIGSLMSSLVRVPPNIQKIESAVRIILRNATQFQFQKRINNTTSEYLDMKSPTGVMVWKRVN